MDKCRKCGIHIDNGLWCKKCRERVDEEIVDRIITRPFEYYFKHYIKRKKKSDLSN